MSPHHAFRVRKGVNDLLASGVPCPLQAPCRDFLCGLGKPAGGQAVVVDCHSMAFFSESRCPGKGESCRKTMLPPDRPGNGSQADPSPQKPPRKRRKDAGQLRWEDRDYYV